MKIMKLTAVLAVATFMLANIAVAQKPVVDKRVKEYSGTVHAGLATIAADPLTPVVGNPYTIAPGIGGLDPANPAAGDAFFLAGTGDFVDAIMDGEADQILEDFQNIFDAMIPANPIEADEMLCLIGKDAATGRNIVELTTSVNATTGDTTMFPLDPEGLTIAFDVDGDGTDENLVLEENGLFMGDNAGGNNIFFDSFAGTPVTQLALWELRGFDGELVDIDDDMVADGPFDITAFADFTDPLTGGWNGSVGVVFGADADPATPNTVTDAVATNQLVVTYLSDLDTEFGKDDDFLCGDLNGDGIVSLLDIAPFVELIQTGGFDPAADLNGDGLVTLLDVAPFVDKLIGG